MPCPSTSVLHYKMVRDLMQSMGVTVQSKSTFLSVLPNSSSAFKAEQRMPNDEIFIFISKFDYNY